MQRRYPSSCSGDRPPENRPFRGQDHSRGCQDHSRGCQDQFRVRQDQFRGPKRGTQQHAVMYSHEELSPRDLDHSDETKYASSVGDHRQHPRHLPLIYMFNVTLNIPPEEVTRKLVVDLVRAFGFVGDIVITERNDDTTTLLIAMQLKERRDADGFLAGGYLFRRVENKLD